ncbi:MAG: hypothetical protein H7A51_13380 [Akkermansiaceae bacterium]|nr:hypothetical protein [Akkermansiaceae bacterium]
MKTYTLNPEIVEWIESGHIHEALTGRGVYFLPDHTCRDQHDVMLVMYVLLSWATQASHQPLVSDALSITCQKLHAEGDLETLNNLLLAHQIQSDDLGIDIGFNYETK